MRSDRISSSECLGSDNITPWQLSPSRRLWHELSQIAKKDVTGHGSGRLQVTGVCIDRLSLLSCLWVQFMHNFSRQIAIQPNIETAPFPYHEIESSIQMEFPYIVRVGNFQLY